MKNKIANFAFLWCLASSLSSPCLARGFSQKGLLFRCPMQVVTSSHSIGTYWLGAALTALIRWAPRMQMKWWKNSKRTLEAVMVWIKKSESAFTEPDWVNWALLVVGLAGPSKASLCPFRQACPWRAVTSPLVPPRSSASAPSGPVLPVLCNSIFHFCTWHQLQSPTTDQGQCLPALCWG